MKVPWLKVVRIGAELAWDLLRGKLERKTQPPVPKPVGLTHAESELKSRYAREAGKHGVVYGTTPPGQRTGRR